MLYISLIFSAILLGFAFYAARRPPDPIRWGDFIGGGAALALLAFCLLGGAYANVLLFPALLLALVAWALVRHRVRWFFPFAAAAFLIAYGIVSWPALEDTRRKEWLREQYPVELMADRVPEPRPVDDRVPLSPAAVRRLDELDKWVEKVADEGDRPYELRRLHAKYTQGFVNSPGFGQLRMISGRVTEANLRPPDRDEPPEQPGSPFLPTDTVPQKSPPAAAEPSLYDLHAAGVLDFVNPAGFGWVQPDRKAAGFLPHAFSQPPAAPEKWAVERVELIGLLLHPDPVVYVSDRLPAMDRLRKAPTRRLDTFETAGLAALRAGEDLHRAPSGGRLRMVGSLRNGNQCAQCHGGERGDLLGAFSYTLRPATGP